MKLTEKDKITANMLADRVNMLAAQGRDSETADLRAQHAAIMAKATTPNP